MQGRKKSGPSTGRSPSPSSASPSSSSSAHAAFDSVQQQQQQIFRQIQSLQQQQFRKSEGDQGHLPYQSPSIHGGVVPGRNFQPSSNFLMKNSCNSSQQHGSPQAHEGNQNEGQGSEQNTRNPLNQAYFQYAYHAAQQKPFTNNQAQNQPGKMTMVNCPSGREKESRTSGIKMPELMSLQSASQAQASLGKKSAENFSNAPDKQIGHMAGVEQRGELKPQQTGVGQFVQTNLRPPIHTIQSQTSPANISNKQFSISQLQAVHNWALERGIDMSLPGNANLVAQLIPSCQSRQSEIQKSDENNMPAHQLKQQVNFSLAGNENSEHGCIVGSSSGQAGILKSRQIHQTGLISTPGQNTTPIADKTQMQQQYSIQSKRENQNDRVSNRHPMSDGNAVPVVHPSPVPSGMYNTIDRANLKTPVTGSEIHQMQNFRDLRQLDRSFPQSGTTSSTEDARNHSSTRVEHSQLPQQRVGFTKQQLHVLKAQILAFRRLKNTPQSGQGIMPEELLRSIIPPPLDLQPHQQFPLPRMVRQDSSTDGTPDENAGPSITNDKAPQVAMIKSQNMPKEELPIGPAHNEKTPVVPGFTRKPVEHAKIGASEKLDHSSLIKSEMEDKRGNEKNSSKCDQDKMPGRIQSVQITATEPGHAKKSLVTSNAPVKEDASTVKYHGPIFDFPFFMRKHDSFGTAASVNCTNLLLTYDPNDLLDEEGAEVLIKKREENLRKIGGLLAMNLDRKRIRPDLVLRLQIEERKLRLLDRQARLRDEVDHQQQEIMAMSDRPYRKFVKQCERQRIDLVRQIQLSQKLIREKQLKLIFQWRKKLLEAHWAIRDARTTRNRGVAKYHERMLREFSKRKDGDRNKRMEALKNNDVDRYREMLLEQQTNISGDAAQRYSVLSSFLTQTEDYLHKLGGKITVAKNNQEVEEASRAAASAGRSQGLSEEEVKAAAACAGEEVLIRNRFSEMNAPRDSLSVNKYYNLAHAVNEKVIQQPSMLRAGTLRDYQLVGLQWMLSLYNNKLNGILADEMGLGKTVQVMALIAHLMEYKGNYGPHLIIVPNAVLVNWKGELYNWLPSVSCLFYVGTKDQRAKLFSQEVCALKFNVLVTTYEFVMFDRSKLSKVDWKYIIIDEAQRMKDRESVLARDLDRYRCQRRLLLTGTPLQNDLKELWSLLNLLLPDVFDNRKAFHDWFSKPFQKDGPSHDPEEDDWLETEKKVIIIHRLHQILEPFMLRRRVEDVEGSLPRKVSIVLRCRMSAMQGAIYDWVKATSTIRVDPEDELCRVQRNPSYQIKTYKNLNNKCMELRKACNHPLLNYPFFNDYSKEFLVRSCGKLWILDRILVKLQRAGHRVLLFSTMTKLLDIIEEYLQWRCLSYRRIDGSTSLEDRESAIVDFNNLDCDCFIFLLSIRAAGRGLNLQSADTVVIYDPDPNPQNEEQAVARAHRIGQKREVKVIYLEAVVDKIPSYQKEDELRNGGSVDSEDDLAGKDRYIGSIESLIRSNIQQFKIDMADEVINAGRFDQRTTHEERRMTLETLLHDDERYQETVHNVPSLPEVNRMIARSEEEIEMFDQMDEDFDWTGDMMKYYQVPKWLRAGSGEISALTATLSKNKKASLNIPEKVDLEPRETSAGPSPSITERRGSRRGSADKRYIYTELDDDDGEDYEASSEERIVYSLQDERETGEYGDCEINATTSVLPSVKDRSEEDVLVGDVDTSEFYQATDGRHIHLFDQDVLAVDSGSSASLRLQKLVTPSTSQKFASLSSLETKPGSILNRLPEELEEGEIAMSGDSHVDFQHSQSSNHDHDDGEDEHILHPKLKRKRSIRFRPRHTLERPEGRGKSSKAFPSSGLQFGMQIDQEFGHVDEPLSMPSSVRQDMAKLPVRHKISLKSRKVKTTSTHTLHAVSKSTRSNCFSGSFEDAAEHSGGSWSSKVSRQSSHNLVNTRVVDTTQKKCKSVISRFQRRVDNDGHRIVPVIYDFWKNSSVFTTKKLLDPRKIGRRVESFKYNGVLDFISDVQLMLKNLAQHFDHTDEVCSEARKLHDLFLDIMKSVFPDTDFRAARQVSFSVHPGATLSQSPRYAGGPSLSKHRLLNVDVGSEVGHTKFSRRGAVTTDEVLLSPGHAPKSLKEARSSGSQGGHISSPPFPSHPGDLVVNKGRRKDRDKSAALQRIMGCASPSNPGSRGLGSPPSMGRTGPYSPANPGRLGSTSSTSSGRGSRVLFQKDGQQNHQAARQVGWARHRPQPQEMTIDDTDGVDEEEAQWAKPVKRSRTDSGKRRPSHL